MMSLMLPLLLLSVCALWTCHGFVAYTFVKRRSIGHAPFLAHNAVRKRDWVLHRMGFKNKGLRKSSSSSSVPASATRGVAAIRNVTTLAEFEAYWDDAEGHFSSHDGARTKKNYQSLLRGVNVIGDTQIIGSAEWRNYTHPVVQILHQRRRQREQAAAAGVSTTSQLLSDQKDDGCKVALAIEGGGMRGCVSAGMVCAIHHLNLTESLNVVYGSSAGTIVGAYLITGQLPWFGPELYYDRLTTAGRQFIDSRRILRALGLGLLDPRLLKDVLTRRESGGKPVLNLDFLLKTTVQETKPLDWETFVRRQASLPLNVVTSGLMSEKAVVLNMANGGFETLDELTDCMHASCLLPGIAGPVMNLDMRVLRNEPMPKGVPKMILKNNMDDTNGETATNDRLYEPLADALLYEPLPYRTAIAQDNVTHCIILRSRPDGVDVTGKGGWAEKRIAKRFFKTKNKRLAHQYRRMAEQEHKYIYAQDILRLNTAAYSERDPYDNIKQNDRNEREPHLMAVAVPPGSPEVSRLEVRRLAIFEGLRRGFARAYDCLVEDPAERGRGHIVAQQYFPDEILDYNPLDIDVTDESAFATYLKQQGVAPKVWSSSK